MRARNGFLLSMLIAFASAGPAQDAATKCSPAPASRPALVVAWQQAMFLPVEWTGVCETAQRYLRE